MPVSRFAGAFLWMIAAVCMAVPRALPATRAPGPVPPGSNAPTAPGRPVPGMSIAAVVNDEVISVYDLVSRLRMTLLSSNIPDTPDARQKVEAQVLRSLVDEKL